MALVFWVVLVLLLVILYGVLRPYLQRQLAPPIVDTAVKGDPGTIDFGKEFVFGTSTAAWQIEKDVAPSNWTLFERKTRPDGTPCAPPHGNACDSVAHFDEDLALMKQLNVKAYRFGISWSAIHVAPNEFNPQYFATYIDQLKKLNEAGIRPMVTLWHFETPAWLEEKGGLLSDDFLQHFTDFLDFVLPSLTQHCDWFITVNEPDVFSFHGYFFGLFPPGDTSFSKFTKAATTLMTAHAKAYAMIHALLPNALVSFAKNIVPYYPLHKYSLIETLIATLYNVYNRAFLECLNTGVLNLKILGISLYSKAIPGLKDSWDFIGINHYFCNWVSLNPFDWKDSEFTPIPLTMNLKKYASSDFSWCLVHESLETALRYANRFNTKGIPIYVTEHGIADAKDEKRGQYTLDTLAHLCTTALPVKGYFHWSLMDNYEWADGYSKRFGLIEVNFETQQRTKRPSSLLFAQVAAKSL